MTHLLLYSLLAGAVITDRRSHKIYNLWVLPGGLLGILLSFFCRGPQGLGRSLAAVLLAFALLFPVYLFGGLGGGDVKLFMAVSAFLAPDDVFLCIFWSFVCGAVFSVISILRTKDLHGTIHFAIPVCISILFLYGGKL